MSKDNGVVISEPEAQSPAMSPDSGLESMQENTPVEEVLKRDFSNIYDDMPKDNQEDSSEETENVISASMQFTLNSQVPQNDTKETLDEEVKYSTEVTPTVSVKIDQSKGEPSTNKDISTKNELGNGGLSADLHNGLESVKLSGDSETMKSNVTGSDSSLNDRNELQGTRSTAIESSRSRPETDNLLDLPSTVTVLNHKSGSKVYIVGTAHFSKESQDDVVNTIRITRPNIIVLELCESRKAVFQLDEETLLNDSKNLDFNKIRMVIRHHGTVQGILYILFLSVSAHITKQLNMAPGGEFRVAIQEARRSCKKCAIQLGDRPIHVTLGRALASLSVWQKIKLMVYILSSKGPISKEEVENCKKKDFIEEMLAEMTDQFPGISEVFVKERDIFLTKSLNLAADPSFYRPPRTGAMPRTVVAVVGMGHVAGITKLWDQVDEFDINKIMVIPPPRLSDRIALFTLKASVIGLLGFGAYKCMPSSSKTFLRSSLTSSFLYVSSQWTKIVQK